MAVLFSTPALVLTRRDWREADRIYHVLTPGHGKLELVGRGARKSLAKLGPHLESFAEVELLVVRGRAYDTVAGVERRASFSRVYQDPIKTLFASQLLLLLDQGIRVGAPDPGLYEQVASWLHALHDSPTLTPSRGAFLFSVLAIKLLAMFGHRPELSQCVSCRGSLPAGQVYWHAARGGAVCVACARADASHAGAARPIADEIVKLLRLGLAQPILDLLRVRLPGEHLLGFHEAVESLLIAHFPTIPAVSLRSAIELG